MHNIELISPTQRSSRFAKMGLKKMPGSFWKTEEV
jgi:hypothetical protein